MNYGMYLSAASLRIGHARMDVLANNMANVNTTSFKQDLAVVRSRKPATEVNDLPGDLVIPVLDDVQGGLGTGGAYTDFSQGKLQPTGGDWDTAINGDGFFAVHNEQGETLYSRDGRFEVREGKLVTAADGFAVLNESGQEISGIPAGRPVISSDGSVSVGNWNDRLGRWDFDNPHLLVKQGKNTYRPDSDAGLGVSSEAMVKQGYIEGSGVDPTRTLVEMINIQRAYDASAKMIQYTDAMLGSAVKDIATIA